MKKCITCKTELNNGATRCASCGRFVGWRGSFFHYASWFGAIASVLSLITIAISGYFDVLAPRKTNLSVRVSEATFLGIKNLTCDASKFGDTKPLTPATFGSPPGDKLLVEGAIENVGNLAGELRFSDGSIAFEDEEWPKRPLAALDPVDENSRYFVEAGGTISFAITMPVYRSSSAGFYVAEIGLDPQEIGRKLYMSERINLFYYTYESGRRSERRVTQTVDFYLEPVSKGWMVDGKPFEYLCS